MKVKMKNNKTNDSVVFLYYFKAYEVLRSKNMIFTLVVFFLSPILCRIFRAKQA